MSVKVWRWGCILVGAHVIRGAHSVNLSSCVNVLLSWLQICNALVFESLLPMSDFLPLGGIYCL